MNDTPEAVTPTPPPASAWQGAWRGWLRPFLVVVVLMVGLRSSVMDWNVVPTGSMKPTIVEGDYILVNKLAYDLRAPLTGQRLWTWGDPKRGEIVVFTPPGEHDRYVKRIVGQPGDELELRDNRLFVNGRAAHYHDLPAADHQDVRPEAGEPAWFGSEMVAGTAHAVMLSPERGSLTSFGPLVVPPGHYFMMGDNRDNSKDSRYFGCVARDRILGRAPGLVVSLDPLRHNAPRWWRFFTPLR
jgi:signal peptidase I